RIVKSISGVYQVDVNGERFNTKPRGLFRKKKFSPVVGERRFRASKIAGLKYVSAIIKDLTDEDMMELVVIENLQREDLNAIEEAESYQRLMTDLKITQQEVVSQFGSLDVLVNNAGITRDNLLMRMKEQEWD
ncbi:SDR family NAD(P)-dependent oxidoreductase, partial [Staphylococcus aureus]|uniref:SDR family NAD(P)-dependent oxidoreductase n=1 Tax=Staphylococcus aureus TaxID=1280 RepID=UPI00210DB97A